MVFVKKFGTGLHIVLKKSDGFQIGDEVFVEKLGVFEAKVDDLLFDKIVVIVERVVDLVLKREKWEK